MKTNNLPSFIKNAKKLNLIGPCSIDKSKIDYSLSTIIIDGGLEHKLTFKEQFSIGDGDSTSEDLDLLLPKEKDQSDLAVALSKIEQRDTQINLHGFLGGRRDHELIVLGEVYKHSSQMDSFAYFEKHYTILPRGIHELKINGLFSLLTLEENLITISGNAKYLLEKATPLLPLSSLGLSNQGTGEVEIKCSRPLIVYT